MQGQADSREHSVSIVEMVVGHNYDTAVADKW